jgi:hypothetical protein
VVDGVVACPELADVANVNDESLFRAVRPGDGRTLTEADRDSDAERERTSLLGADGGTSNSSRRKEKSRPFSCKS